MMKLQGGQMWKTRKGQYVTMVYNPREDWLEVEEDGRSGYVYGHAHNEDGTEWYVFADCTHPYDLVELVSG